MTRTVIGALLMAGLAIPAHADVTIKQTVEGKGMGQGAQARSTTYIKGNRMRTETVTGDKTLITIFDVDAQKMFIFDSKKKEADVWDMAAFGQEIGKNVDASSIRGDFKANGQTKPIAGKTANGYDMSISMDSAMGGSKDMTMTVTISGPVWIVKNSPGAADFVKFYKGAVEKGWIFSDPRAAKGQPGQAKAMAEMYKKMADAGGIAYENDMQIKMSGSGPMAGLMAKMGNVQMHTVVDSVDTGALDDALFAPPSGYKLNPKK
jgi:hypothetical protein